MLEAFKMNCWKLVMNAFSSVLSSYHFRYIRLFLLSVLLEFRRQGVHQSHPVKGKAARAKSRSAMGLAL
jgi:hypothetical protein